MRVLVTGGRGTLGAVLVEELTLRGHAVVSCDITHSDGEHGFGLRTDVPSAVYARCDVANFRQLQRVFETLGMFDYVFHLAAEVGRWSGEDFYEQLWLTNAVGTKNVIRLQEELGFRLIHFSSSEIYGDCAEPIEEALTDQRAVRLQNDYAMSKWVNEQQIRNSVIHRRTETVVVRLFNTYGPGEYYTPYRSVNCRFIYCALMGIPWVVFRGHHRSSSFVADTVAAVSNLVEHFRPGEVYNIASDQYHSIEDLSDIVLRTTGASPSLVEYRGPEPLTVRSKRADNSKAVRDLGYRCSVSLEEGVRRTVDWMRDVYAVPEKGART